MRIQMGSTTQCFVALGLLIGLVGCTTAKQDWDEARKKDTITAYEEFLQRHSDTEQADLAKKRLTKLQAKKRLSQLSEHEAWIEAYAKHTIEGYEDFSIAFPHGTYASQASETKTRLEWDQTRQADTMDAYELFISKYPTTIEAMTAKKERSRLSNPGKLLVTHGPLKQCKTS